MKDLEKEVLRMLLIELFLATPRKRPALPQPDSQEAMNEKTMTTIRQGSDNQPGENHHEKEAKA